MSKQHTKQAGFTLVEISLAMAIFTFMLLVVSMAYINIARLYNASTAARAVQQNNRFAMEQISRVGRTSSSVKLVANQGDAKKGLCFKSSQGDQLFYLHNLDNADDKKNELMQSSSCTAPSSSNSQVLSSAGVYAADITMDDAVQGTVTINLWMASKTDLVRTDDGSGLKCSPGVRAEFCAINKLTTTVELRGN